jgi:DNA-binding PucR family transcriptional regulator
MATTEPDLKLRLAVAQRLAADLDGLVDRMMLDEVGSVPALGTDAAFIAEVRASNRANAESIIALMSSPDITIGGAVVPAAALDVVRTTVRRGLDLEVIYRAYRRGQSVVWGDVLSHIGDLVGPDEDVVGIVAQSSALMFDYIDLVITQVIAAAQREREEILGGALARRIETVRLLLDDAPIELGAASKRLGYELARWHTGVVVWADAGSEAHGILESVALGLARSIDARPPLTVPAGVTALWAWIGTDKAPDRADLRADLPAGVRVAVGPTRLGAGGFRATHLGAIEVHDLVAGRGEGPAVALHEDYEVTLLLGDDVRAAAEFVQRVLGDLADDSPSAERLRETTRIFLDEGSNAPKAAARLFTHRNTVLQRIERATALLGHRPEANRLAVSVALELAHNLGARVLAAP